MKKRVFLAGIFVLAMVISACSKTETGSQTGDASVATTVDENGKKKSVTLIPSVLFYPEGSLWAEDDDGKMVWYNTFYQGQVFYAYPSEEGSLSEEIFTAKMTKQGKKEPEKDLYAKVYYNNKNYWIDKDLIIPNAVPKVVIEDGYNYGSDNTADLSKTTITKGQIVAVNPAYVKSADSDIECYNVSWRKIGGKSSYRDVYIKKSIVSDKEDDLIAQRYLNRLDAYKKNDNQTVLSEIYENLMSLDLSSDYKEQVQQAFAD